MSAAAVSGRWQRRARPLLGTLVEIGGAPGDADAAAIEAAFDAAFAEVAGVQACMSRFEAASDLGRFHALQAGSSLTVDPRTAEVLQAAAALHAMSGGVFDVALGSAHDGHRLDGLRLHKRDAAVRLDLGGLAKGYAVDRAVAVLQALGWAAGCVNAGGDLRAFGAVDVPVLLRDEASGGVRPFASLADGALATSRFGAGARSALHGLSTDTADGQAHVSVAAPLCLWADALTKLVAATGRTDHPALAAHGATAWLH